MLNKKPYPGKWLPMEKAPKDKPILALCRHAANTYFDEKIGGLTTYGANCEVLTHVIDGPNVVEWGGEYHEEDWESGIFVNIPAWWFRYGSDYEEPANPVGWRPIPEFTD
jgi:hypothetical protein